MTFRVRKIEKRDEGCWRELWDAYTRFYEREPCEAITSRTWTRIMDPEAPIKAIVAEDDSQSTSHLTPVCYLQDLFVDPNRQGAGVGQLLIDWLLAEMRAIGWSRVYWHTKENNYRARGLYDKYTQHSGFLRYVITNTLNR
jgi:GNAT superfamily N-acetyltransferase